MTVLLDKFVLEVLKSLPCLIVARLHLPLEVDPDDGGSLPCYGLQLRPVWEVAPAGEREVYVVAVGDLLLSPDKEIIVLTGLASSAQANLVRTFPLVLDTAVLNVWKHSMWILWMGGLILILSKNKFSKWENDMKPCTAPKYWMASFIGLRSTKYHPENDLI